VKGGKLREYLERKKPGAIPHPEENAGMEGLDTSTRIGVGRTAEIFSWGDGRVLKLFRAGSPAAHALREMNTFRCVHEAGLPCPAVYPSRDHADGLVRIGDRLGFVMDRVDGPSMLSVLAARPWLLVRYARMLAAVHRSLHLREVPGLPSQRERFRQVIELIRSDVGNERASRIQQALEALPDGRVVCHGDFHPDNVLLSSSGPMIIDWGPATAGNAAADIAWTEYLFRHGGYPPGMTRRQRAILFLLRRAFLVFYRRAYVRRRSFDWSAVRAWAPVIAAIRLGDRIPEEREPLLASLRQHFDA
jgi:aminoglycoside phosphotransferase (APT) family kinase protein